MGFWRTGKSRRASTSRYPLRESASPTTNMQKRKTITSVLIAARASAGAIWPVRRTATAPPSMTCQIRSVNPPTCRTAIRRKTAARMMIAIYVKDYFECRLMSLGTGFERNIPLREKVRS